MSRITEVDPERADPSVRRVFDAQKRQWGVVLAPYPIYGRRPSIFRAVNGMWAGLAQSGLLDRGLVSLLNRRVASLNGCVF
ncbi:MAG: hypothetical protein QOD06_112 [Candidatus Binatota bacterium]|nr:hypothetical protein [Candidatus Binatota bacterium]